MVSDPWSPKQLPPDDCQIALQDGVSGVATYLFPDLTVAILYPGTLGQVADESTPEVAYQGLAVTRLGVKDHFVAFLRPSLMCKVSVSPYEYLPAGRGIPSNIRPSSPRLVTFLRQGSRFRPSASTWTSP